MAGLMAAVAIMLIMSSVAFQAWTDLLRRENEAEMMFRAKDIVRAIQRYRRDHGGAGPARLEDLMEPGPKGQYYMRRLYTDPLVPDGKWGLLYLGPGGQIIDPNAAQTDPFAGTGLGGGMEPSSMSSLGMGGGRKGIGMGSKGTRGGLGSKGIGGFGESEVGEGGGIAGMLIAGVRTLCEEQPFRVYNGLTEYSEWLFTYLDLEAQRARGSGRRPGIGSPTLNPGDSSRPGTGR
jgi:type II secretory pathway pseudopilin PulG